MKKYIMMIAALLCLTLVGCSQPAPSQGSEQVAMVYIGTKAGASLTILSFMTGR